MDIVINDCINELPSGSRSLTCQGSAWLHLLTCLGYDPEHPPLGDCLARYHQLDGHWLVASPIHWDASHNNAMITASGDELDLSDGQSRLLFADVAAYLVESGLQLHYHDAHTWLVKRDGLADLDSRSLHAMRHQPMMNALQGMDSSLFWPQLMTELQMLLSAHHSNLLRPCTINGLWFYGNAPLGERLPKTVLTDDPRLLAAWPEQCQPLRPLKARDLVFSNQASEALRSSCAGKSVRWFWNNAACAVPAPSLWKRLWRS